MERIFLVAQNPDLRLMLALIIQHQSGRPLQVFGGAWGNADTLASIEQLQPEVVVLVVGLEVGRALHLVRPIRQCAPECQVLLVDTLGEASLWQSMHNSMIDRWLRSEQLATDLVPTLCQLVEGRGAD